MSNNRVSDSKTSDKRPFQNVWGLKEAPETMYELLKTASNQDLLQNIRDTAWAVTSDPKSMYKEKFDLINELSQIAMLSQEACYDVDVIKELYSENHRLNMMFWLGVLIADANAVDGQIRAATTFLNKRSSSKIGRDEVIKKKKAAKDKRINEAEIEWNKLGDRVPPVPERNRATKVSETMGISAAKIRLYREIWEKRTGG